MSLTNHARQRLDERTSLTPDELAEILDDGYTTLVSLEKHRKHLLFYSPEDRQCFVAVVDEDDREIVTIRYPEQSVHGVVSFEAMKDLQVKHDLRMQSTVNEPVVVLKKPDPQPAQPVVVQPKVFRILVAFEYFKSGATRFKSVSVPIVSHPECVDNLQTLQDISEVKAVVQKCMLENRRPSEFCPCGAWVRYGKQSSVMLMFDGADVL